MRYFRNAGTYVAYIRQSLVCGFYRLSRTSRLALQPKTNPAVRGRLQRQATVACVKQCLSFVLQVEPHIKAGLATKKQPGLTRATYVLPLLKRGGFTLIEIMIAITIFSLISTFMYSVVTDTIAARKKMEKIMAINHIGRFFISRITRDLTCASIFPISSSGSFIGKQFYRDGKARDELYFTAFTRSYFTARPRIDQAEISYYFKIPDEGPELLLRRESDLIDADVKIGGESYEITDRVEEMKLRYLGEKGWVEKWNPDASGPVVMPKAVSVELTLNDGNRSYFFSAIVRIPV